MNNELDNIITKKIDQIAKDNNIYHLGRVVKVNDFIVEATGLDNAFFFEKVYVGNEENIGYVDRIAKNKVYIALVKTSGKIEVGDKVSTTGEALTVSFSKDDSFGMIIDPFGADKITGKNFANSKQIDVETPKISIMDRTDVCRPLETGIAAIDLMYPVGRGQRQLIIGDKKIGKTQILLDTIVNQKDKQMVCIYVAIGKTKKDLKRLYAKLTEMGAGDYTIIVTAFNDDPAPLIKLTPYAAMSMAEEFLWEGKDVLVCIDDLKKHADVCREIALISEKNTGRDAYPADIFYSHSRLLEKGCQHKNGGSITVLPVVETKGGDITDYISTNIISITDGQIVLSTKNFEKGQKPALNYGLSVSRLGGAVQKDSIKKLGATVRRELLSYLETADVYQLVNIDSMPEEIRQKTLRGKKLLDSLKQPKYSPFTEEDLIKNFSFVLETDAKKSDKKDDKKNKKNDEEAPEEKPEEKPDSKQEEEKNIDAEGESEDGAEESTNELEFEETDVEAEEEKSKKKVAKENKKQPAEKKEEKKDKKSDDKKSDGKKSDDKKSGGKTSGGKDADGKSSGDVNKSEEKKKEVKKKPASKRPVKQAIEIGHEDLENGSLDLSTIDISGAVKPAMKYIDVDGRDLADAINVKMPKRVLTPEEQTKYHLKELSSLIRQEIDEISANLAKAKVEITPAVEQKVQNAIPVEPKVVKKKVQNVVVTEVEETLEEKIERKLKEKIAEKKAQEEKEARLKAEKEASAKAEAEKKAQREAAEKAKAEALAKAEAEKKAQREAAEKARVEAERLKAAAEAERKAKVAARAEAARIKTEEDAKKKAEIEAKKKAEAEAEAKKKAEIEAKKKAEIEEKLRVKAEAKAKKEADEKAAAEKEAAAKAAALVKKQAELEARNRAAIEERAKKAAVAKAKREAMKKAEAERAAKVEEKRKAVKSIGVNKIEAIEKEEKIAEKVVTKNADEIDEIDEIAEELNDIKNKVMQKKSQKKERAQKKKVAKIEQEEPVVNSLLGGLNFESVEIEEDISDEFEKAIVDVASKRESINIKRRKKSQNNQKVADLGEIVSDIQNNQFNLETGVLSDEEIEENLMRSSADQPDLIDLIGSNLAEPETAAVERTDESSSEKEGSKRVFAPLADNSESDEIPSEGSFGEFFKDDNTEERGLGI